MGGGPEFPTGDRLPIWHMPIAANAQDQQPYLRGLCDMGSNGIRFSISDLAPPYSRILPTVHASRVGISLYDVQFDGDNKRVPIPDDVIADVVAALLRFQVVCSDFGVLKDNIRVVATEATRTALNSAEFLETIRTSTGLSVELLSKEDEGHVGALGIASSLSDMSGLAMDLGGGSTQITWMICRHGTIELAPQKAFSFPYGAAALTARIHRITVGRSKDEARRAVLELHEEIVRNFRDAYDKLSVPAEMVDDAAQEGGFQLYLSGGGFRGWGYLLLSQQQSASHHYPFSIINGFRAHRKDFANVEAVKATARAAKRVFGVSDRRREQVPAVAFLINALFDAIPHGIREARFCQGGVREGLLFDELTPYIRAQDPLEVATLQFAHPAADALAEDLFAALPPFEPTPQHSPRRFPDTASEHVIRSFSNILYVHSGRQKESASASALYSTTTGILASTHGLSHVDRALLALLLEERYDGELPPQEAHFKDAIAKLLTPEEVWWTKYLGRVGRLLGRLYPAGIVRPEEPRVQFQARWMDNLENSGDRRGIDLVAMVQRKENDPFRFKESLERDIKKVVSAGKKKNWVGGSEGWGLKVRGTVKEVEMEDWDD